MSTNARPAVSCTNVPQRVQHSLEGRGLQAPGMARIKVQQAPHDQTPQAGSGAAQRPPPHSHADGGPHALRSAAAAGRRAPGVHASGGGGGAVAQAPLAAHYVGELDDVVGAHGAAAHHEHAARAGAGAGGRDRGYHHHRGQVGLEGAEAGAAHHTTCGWSRWGGDGDALADDCYNSADEDDKGDAGEGRGAAGMGRECDMDEAELENVLKKEKGFRIKRMEEDGNCLFRAIADQIYGDPGMHAEVRRLCMDYLEAERSHFSQFVTQDFDHYIRRKRHDKIFGNNLEMQAMAELFNRPIEVPPSLPRYSLSLCLSLALSLARSFSLSLSCSRSRSLSLPMSLSLARSVSLSLSFSALSPSLSLSRAFSSLSLSLLSHTHAYKRTHTHTHTQVYCDSAHPMQILHDSYTQTCDSTPLRLSYHRGNH